METFSSESTLEMPFDVSQTMVTGGAGVPVEQNQGTTGLQSHLVQGVARARTAAGTGRVAGAHIGLEDTAGEGRAVSRPLKPAPAPSRIPEAELAAWQQKRLAEGWDPGRPRVRAAVPPPLPVELLRDAPNVEEEIRALLAERVCTTSYHGPATPGAEGVEDDPESVDEPGDGSGGPAVVEELDTEMAREPALWRFARVRPGAVAERLRAWRAHLPNPRVWLSARPYLRESRPWALVAGLVQRAIRGTRRHARRAWVGLLLVTLVVGLAVWQSIRYPGGRPASTAHEAGKAAVGPESAGAAKAGAGATRSYPPHRSAPVRPSSGARSPGGSHRGETHPVGTADTVAQQGPKAEAPLPRAAARATRPGSRVRLPDVGGVVGILVSADLRASPEEVSRRKLRIPGPWREHEGAGRMEAAQGRGSTGRGSTGPVGEARSDHRVRWPAAPRWQPSPLGGRALRALEQRPALRGLVEQAREAEAAEAWAEAARRYARALAMAQRLHHRRLANWLSGHLGLVQLAWGRDILEHLRSEDDCREALNLFLEAYERGFDGEYNRSNIALAGACLEDEPDTAGRSSGEVARDGAVLASR